MLQRTTYKQGSFVMIPDRGAKNNALYYGYSTVNPSSAASGYQKLGALTVYLYEDMTTGLLGLHCVCDAYGEVGAGGITVTVTGLPPESTVDVSDDPGEAVKTAPDTVVGTFAWGSPNTDGMAIGNINNFTNIVITVSGSTGKLTEWNVCSYSGQTVTLPFSTTPSITISKTVEQIDTRALITPSIAPGYYPTAQSLTLAVPTGLTVRAVLNGTTPAAAKIIAYDNLNPPNPFIAVVDDGRGRVVLDGGFPKFYSSAWANAVSYAQLSDAFKYLYHALNWVANPVKVRAGNNKFLVFNDGPSNYDIATFRATLDGIAALAGFTLVHTNRTSYGGGASVDISYATLDAYCGVLIFSGQWLNYVSGVSGLTASALANIKQYRESGNGLIVVADHQDVAAQSSYQVTGNSVAKLFGASFYGSIDRTPISSATLKALYGNHPLWNNLNGSFYAGVSEGNVSVTNYPVYAGETFALGVGFHNLNVLIEDQNGAMYSVVYSYLIGVTDPVVLYGASTVKPVTSKPFFMVSQINGQATSGVIKANGVVIGSWSTAAGTTSTSWLNNGDIAIGRAAVNVEVTVLQPLEYTKAVSFARPIVNCNPLSLSSVFAAARSAELAGTYGSPSKHYADIRAVTLLPSELTVSKLAKDLDDYF